MNQTEMIEMPADTARRTLWTLLKLGEAYRAGAIRVDESACFGLAAEARTLLDELGRDSTSASELREPDHGREEGQ